MDAATDRTDEIERTDQIDQVEQIDQDAFAALLTAGEPFVVDVREADEYRAGHVPGARNVPLSVLRDRLSQLPTDRPVQVICRSGHRSATATAVLRAAGIDAANVVGGTEAWHRRGGRLETTPLTVLTLDTPGLGDRSYLAHDGRVALVVDPQRDIDRVLALADAEGVRITHVVESHLHNDYVTGGYQLARRVGAQYLLNADDPVRFDRVGVRDGDFVAVGDRMRVRVLLTPGHTHTHLSYALFDGDEPVAVFTGGSLLYGSTGRPDLLGPAHTDALAHAQWHSARRLAGELPDATAVYPTHGFGSFCSATQSSGDTSTIGEEKLANPALTRDLDTYVEELLAGLDAFPAYYAHMSPANAAGPGPIDLSPPAPADPSELRRRIDAGEWVVDLRTSTAFAAGHVAGTLNFGLDGQFVTYLGWLIPWGTPVTLLGATADDVAEAQRELVRIGIDRPAAAAVGSPDDWAGGDPLRRHRTATFADLAAEIAAGRRPAVLDVRRRQERREQHLPGSVHIPIHDLLARLDEVPAGPVWVHCAGGYRAGVVASLLDARGVEVVAVDDAFDNAAPAGLRLVTGADGSPGTPDGQAVG